MLEAPGRPGIPARWTSSAKTGVGTALSDASRVWFTISHGILNEVYYPRVDQACIRDLGLIVTDGDGFFAEEKRDCDVGGGIARGRRPGLSADEHASTEVASASSSASSPTRAARLC